MSYIKFILFIIGLMALCFGKYQYTTRINSHNNPALNYKKSELLYIYLGYGCFIVAFILAAFNL